MRKAVFLLGLGYLLWGLWQLLSVIRITSLYQGFGTTTPSITFLLPLPVGILSYGIIQVVGYFVNFQNKKIYTVLFILGLGFVVFWVAYTLMVGAVANRRIKMILDEIGYPQDRF
jgi:hypothetical protein